MVRKSKDQVDFLLAQIEDLCSLSVAVMSANVVMSNIPFHQKMPLVKLKGDRPSLHVQSRNDKKAQIQCFSFMKELQVFCLVETRHGHIGHDESQTTNADSYLPHHSYYAIDETLWNNAFLNLNFIPNLILQPVNFCEGIWRPFSVL